MASSTWDAVPRYTKYKEFQWNNINWGLHFYQFFIFTCFWGQTYCSFNIRCRVLVCLMYHLKIPEFTFPQDSSCAKRWGEFWNSICGCITWKSEYLFRWTYSTKYYFGEDFIVDCQMCRSSTTVNARCCNSASSNFIPFMQFWVFHTLVTKPLCRYLFTGHC